MKEKRFVFSLIIYALFLAGLKGQYYETGQAPAYFQWRKIITPGFTLLYPADYESRAQEIAALTEGSLQLLSARFQHVPDPFTVIIHNHTTRSNGYVTWAPKRMELYPTVEQNALPMDPLEQLLLHETTHVLQVDQLDQGFSKAVSLLFGEQFTGGLSVMLPLWYLEGDAIISETAFSYSGRGRQPHFLKEMPARILSPEKRPSYDQMMLGSFRQYLPDYYKSGYLLTALHHQNDSLWPAVIRRIGSSPFTLNPVNQELKSRGLGSKKKIYNSSLPKLKEHWLSAYSPQKAAAEENSLLPQTDLYTSYRSPAAREDSLLYFLKTNLQRITRIVALHTNSGEESPVYTPGRMHYPLLSQAGSFLCWAEYRPDPRWQNRSYSVIKILDLYTRKTRTLGRHDRLFAPVLSPDASRIAAIRSTPLQENYLVILDRKTGSELESIPAPGNQYLQQAEWSANGESIALISLSEKGEGVLEYSLKEKRWKTRLINHHRDLQALEWYEEKLLLTAAVESANQLCLVTDSTSLVPLTQGGFGLYDPEVIGKLVVLTRYTSRGYEPVSYALPELTQTIQKPLSASFSGDALAKSISKETKLQLLLPERPQYASSPYRKGLHLFQFHSWMPFYADVEDIDLEQLKIKPGLTLLSQNHLSTSFLSLGYEYRQGDHLLHTRYEFKGAYPALKLKYELGGDPFIQKESSSDPDPAIIKTRQSLNAEVYVPLNLSTNRFQRTLYPSLSISYTNRYVYDSKRQVYDQGQWFYQPRLYFSNLYPMAHRDIYPRWGQVLDAFLQYSPTDPDLYGSKINLHSRWFFPGLLPNHSFRLDAGIERQNTSLFVYFNNLDFPRGVNNYLSESLNSYRLTYSLPLCYPDWSLSALAYVKRVRMNLFYDLSQARDVYDLRTGSFAEGRATYRSLGMDLLADYHIFRIPFPLYTGLRVGFLPQEGNTFFELLFNIDVYGFSINQRNRHLN